MVATVFHYFVQSHSQMPSMRISHFHTRVYNYAYVADINNKMKGFAQSLNLITLTLWINTTLCHVHHRPIDDMNYNKIRVRRGTYIVLNAQHDIILYMMNSSSGKTGIYYVCFCVRLKSERYMCTYCE